MLKTTALAALVALTLAGTAQAGDHHPRSQAFQPTGPQPIVDVLKAGGGTVTGTVGKVAANWFVLNDGTNEIDVTGRDFLPEGIESGTPITVVGGVRQGAIQASQIIRADGTSFGQDAFQDRRNGRHHDDD
ncbi:cytochrome c maturation protein CcmE [Azospirillum sp. sgz301742]